MPVNFRSDQISLRVLWRWRWPGLLMVTALAALAWGAHAMGIRPLMEHVVLRLRAAGAPLFFSAMALLPAVGFPLLPFSLAAGPAFIPRLGIGGVIAFSILAVAVNVALSYAIASTFLRPLVEKIMARFGHRLPDPRRESAWGFVTLVRLAPGLPFFAQSYLLGLMKVRLAPYLTVSTLIPASYLTGTIVLGDAVMQGDSRVAFTAVAGIALVGTGLYLVRRQTARKTRSVAAGAA